MTTIHPMEHAACIVVAGMTMPVRLYVGPQKAIATSFDWREARDGETPCEALQALSRAVEERIWRALAESRVQQKRSMTV